MTDFQSLGLSDGLLTAVAENGYDVPTPIQKMAIPLILEGRDLMGLAQTGTGKTAAFGLPLIERLLAENGKPLPKGTRALILAPTRELVNQIAKSLVSFLRKTPLRVTSVVGGVSINGQIKRLSRGTDILVATPGRLLDLVDRNAVDLKTASYLVLDEADQMLDLGFIHALRRISGLVAKERQTLLFSATMPKQINELAQSYLTNPERVEVAPAGKTADKITQSVHFMDQKAKSDFLVEQLQEKPDGMSLVFCRTKHGAERLMRKLSQSGLAAGSIHGNKSQGQRERAIRDLKEGRINVLVATDVAARGIDIPGVSHVYNFDLPEVPENYVHRIGRTARA
uniref:DEAD/DEAH box helicase n=2 Tax=Roseibium sp. TaxID=1936156 RepID=UPI003D0F1328